MTETQTPVELSTLLRRFAARYRAALLTRAGILVALGGALVAALAWRLPAWRVPAGWAAGVPAALGAALLAAVAWWVRRRWIADRDAAGHLDQALGLRERLVTAAEFAAHPEPPALLPLLVEDASRHYAAGTARFPKPVDRTTGLLLAALLLLLVIPRVGVTPPLPGDLPAEPGQQPPDPASPPPAPDKPAQDQTGGGGANAPQPSGGGQQGAHGQPPSMPQQSGADPSSGASSSPGQQSAGKGDATPQQGGGGSENAADRATTAASTAEGQQGREGPAESAQPAGSKEQRQGDPAQRSGQQPGEAQAGRREDADTTSPSAAAGSKRGQQSSSGEQQAGQQDTAAGKPGKGAAKDAQQAGSQGRGQQLSASAGQNMTRAEIQQLLKEVSGELRQLQAQLDAEGVPMRPQAGTSTDADLQGAREALEEGKQGMPVQLKTDTAETKSSRPGAGVGTAAAQASNAAPQARPENAMLSDQPLEEPASARQTVPPEYRDVFNQLQREQPSTNQPRP